MTTWALHTDVCIDEANLHLAALEGAGLLGIVEEAGSATLYLPRRVDGLPVTGRWERVPERDWSAAWKAGIRPVTVGSVTIVPPWLADADTPGDVAPGDLTADDLGPGDLTLVIEPAQAFGTGHHETTTGCLAALQERDLTGRDVLDVGTGTGILALAVARLGARRVVAVDIDPVAVDTARANAISNGVTVDIRLGSVEAVDGERFDVVVANLDTATLVRLAPALAVSLRPAGTLVASGVSLARAGEAVAALRAAGLAVVTRHGREWVVLLARLEPPVGR